MKHFFGFICSLAFIAFFAMSAPAQTTDPRFRGLIVTSEPMLATADVPMGSQQIQIIKFRFVAVGPTDFTVTHIPFQEYVLIPGTGTGAFFNHTIQKNEKTLRANFSFELGDGVVYRTVHFENPLLIPRGSSVTLTMRADVIPSWYPPAYGGRYKTTIETQKGLVAYSTTGEPVQIRLFPVFGTEFRLTHSVAMLTATLLGSSTNRTVNFSRDDLADITIAAHPAGLITTQGMTVTLSGTMPFTQAYLRTYCFLFQPFSGEYIQPASVTFDGATNSWRLRYVFAYTIGSGQQAVFRLRLENFQSLPGSVSGKTLNAEIATGSDFSYSDAWDGSGLNLQLSPSATPVSVCDVSYQ